MTDERKRELLQKVEDAENCLDSWPDQGSDASGAAQILIYVLRDLIEEVAALVPAQPVM
jgi:hypothetical protein